MSEAWNAYVDDLIRSIAEWDDRTSPEDYPDHLLLTPDELKEFARAAIMSPAPPPNRDLVQSMEGIAHFSDALNFRSDPLSKALSQWIEAGRSALKTMGV